MSRYTAASRPSGKIVTTKVSPLAGRRLAAYALDVTGYVGIAAATVPVGALATRTHWGRSPAFAVSASALPVLIAISALTYGAIGIGVWGLLRRSGITMHDKVVSSRVVLVSTAGDGV